MRFIVKTTLEGRTALRVGPAPVLDAYAKLHQALVARAGADAAQLFAEPVVTWGNGEAPGSVSWYADADGDVRPLRSLPPVLRAHHEKSVRDLLDRLLPLRADTTLGPLLTRALVIVDPESVLVVGQRVVLVNWGLLPAMASDTPASLAAQIQATLGPYMSAATAPSAVPPPVAPSPATPPPAAPPLWPTPIRSVSRAAADPAGGSRAAGGLGLEPLAGGGRARDRGPVLCTWPGAGRAGDPTTVRRAASDPACRQCRCDPRCDRASPGRERGAGGADRGDPPHALQQHVRGRPGPYPLYRATRDANHPRHGAPRQRAVRPSMAPWSSCCARQRCWCWCRREMASAWAPASSSDPNWWPPIATWSSTQGRTVSWWSTQARSDDARDRAGGDAEFADLQSRRGGAGGAGCAADPAASLHSRIEQLDTVIAAGFPGVLLRSDDNFRRLLNGDTSAMPHGDHD